MRRLRKPQHKLWSTENEFRLYDRRVQASLYQRRSLNGRTLGGRRGEILFMLHDLVGETEISSSEALVSEPLAEDPISEAPVYYQSTKVFVAHPRPKACKGTTPQTRKFFTVPGETKSRSAAETDELPFCLHLIER